jgi:hypothetical protein
MTGIAYDSKRKDDEVWSSRPAFYFAAVGAAVGFGNVWRFPALMVEYGGGAFFIPYFLAFFLIGILQPSPERSWCSQCRLWLDARCLLQCAPRMGNQRLL